MLTNGIAILLLTNSVYLPCKKNENLLFVTTMDGIEGILPSEISQREKDKCHMISLICGL